MVYYSPEFEAFICLFKAEEESSVICVHYSARATPVQMHINNYNNKVRMIRDRVRYRYLIVSCSLGSLGIGSAPRRWLDKQFPFVLWEAYFYLNYNL